MNLLIPLLLLFSLRAQAGETWLRGNAFSIDSEKLIYIEEHRIKSDSQGLNEFIETWYKKPDGTLFATMTSDFSKSKFVPDIQFHDHRFDLKEEVHLDPDKKTLTIRITKKDATKPKEKTLRFEPRMVAGQGFDNYLRAHFDALASGTLPMAFIVPSKLDFFKFDASMVTDSENGLRKLSLKVHNYFLRIFVQNLQVEYDKKTSRLLTYRGLSNLSDDKGDSFLVQIKYR